MVAILSHQREAILSAVRAMYTDVASRPSQGFHFPVGREACAFVGYPADVLAGIPDEAVESFAGVGYPFAAGGIARGDTVLDIGSGSGTDTLIASALAGPEGRVLGLDLTDAMLRKLHGIVERTRRRNVTPLKGNAEEIPLADESVDVVTSNGVLNLVPDKRRAIAEIFRVLRPGGGVQLADIALGKPITEECRSDPQLWAECVVGAVLEEKYVELFRAAGFTDVAVLGRLDYFSGSASPETRSVASSFRAHSLVLYATRPPGSRTWHPSAWPPAGAAADPADAPPAPEPAADQVLEAYGCTCGTLEPLMAARLRSMETGQLLEVRGDQPELRLGVPAWSRLSGNSLVHTIEDEERTRFFLRRK